MKATLTIPEAAKLLGVGRNLAYQSAAEDGELAGVPVIRVGRRMVVPRARLLAALGLTDTLPSPDPDR
jgi:excisionase family DNA binding protein